MIKASESKALLPLLALLLLFLGCGPVETPESAPAWIPHGEEFWQPRGPSAAGPDLGAAIQRVQHAFMTSPVGPQARAGGYSVSASPGGMALDLGGRGGLLNVRTVGEGGQPWRIEGDVAQRTLPGRGGAVEHVQATAAGLQLSWIFPRAPEDAALQIEVQIAGATPREDAVNPLRFAPEDGGPDLQISAAEAVDFAGRRWPVGIQPTPRGFRIEVPESIRAVASWPLAIDPLLSVTAQMDDPAGVEMNSSQTQPVIATTGSGWLLGWQDTVQSDGVQPNSSYRWRLARLDSDGALLDEDGIDFDAALGNITALALVSDGSRYLVAWISKGDAACCLGEVRYSFFDPASGLLDDPGGVLLGTSADSADVALAYDSVLDRYLLAWTDLNSVQAIRIDPSLGVLDTPPLLLASGLSLPLNPAVVSDGQDFLVVWDSADDVFLSRVAVDDGTLNDTPPVQLNGAGTSARDPAIGYGAGASLVAWTQDIIADGDIFAAFVPTGRAAPDVPLAINAESLGQREPTVAWTGAQFLVVFTDDRSGGGDLSYTQVGPAGVVSDLIGTIVIDGPSSQGKSALVTDGSQMTLAWQMANPGPCCTYHVLAARLDAALTPLDIPPIAVSSAANAQSAPAIAILGGETLVVWQDGRAGDYDLWGMRIDSNGQNLTPAGIELIAGTGDQVEPVLASNGSDYGLAWRDLDGVVYWTLLDDVASPVVPGGTALSGVDSEHVSIASQGSDFLIVWADSRDAWINGWDIYGRRGDGVGNLYAGDLSERAVEDLSAFVLAEAENSTFRSLVKDARRRLRLLGVSDGDGPATSADHPAFTLGIGAAYQRVGPFNYGVFVLDASLRLKGVLRLKLLARPGLGGAWRYDDGASFAPSRRSLFLGFGIAAELRFAGPVQPDVSLGVQMVPNPGGSVPGGVPAGKFLIGPLLAGGLHLPLGAGPLGVRVGGEIGLLVPYLTVRGMGALVLSL